MTWYPHTYAFGPGLKAARGDRIFELVPFINGGALAGYALVVDMARHGWTRIEGDLEHARAEAERILAQGNSPVPPEGASGRGGPP